MRPPWVVALDVLKEMEQNGFTPSAISLTGAIVACARGAQAERALELLARMEKRNVVAVNGAMAATLGAGQRERVIELFDELKAGDDCEPDATSYATAMSTHVELESPERALELCDDFVAAPPSRAPT